MLLPIIGTSFQLSSTLIFGWTVASKFLHVIEAFLELSPSSNRLVVSFIQLLVLSSSSNLMLQRFFQSLQIFFNFHHSLAFYIEVSSFFHHSVATFLPIIETFLHNLHIIVSSFLNHLISWFDISFNLLSTFLLRLVFCFKDSSNYWTLSSTFITV